MNHKVVRTVIIDKEVFVLDTFANVAKVMQRIRDSLPPGAAAIVMPGGAVVLRDYHILCEQKCEAERWPNSDGVSTYRRFSDESYVVEITAKEASEFKH